MRTMKLNDAWDLTVDASGNIAVLDDGPAALEQDVASAQRLFKGELWYDTTRGVPWFDDTLGHNPPDQLVQAHLEAAALTVPGVVQARATLTGRAGRRLRGYTRFLDEQGNERGVQL